MDILFIATAFLIAMGVLAGFFYGRYIERCGWKELIKSSEVQNKAAEEAINYLRSLD